MRGGLLRNFSKIAAGGTTSPATHEVAIIVQRAAEAEIEKTYRGHPLAEYSVQTVFLSKTFGLSMARPIVLK